MFFKAFIITHSSFWLCSFLTLLLVWFIVGSCGAFCFILIQLVLLIDFAHSWNESWVDKMEKENTKRWYIGGSCYTRIDFYSTWLNIFVI